MKCHSLTQDAGSLLDLTRKRNMKRRVCWMWRSSLLLLLVTMWLVGSPVSAGILQMDGFLELQPPSNQPGMHFGFSLSHYTNNSQRWLLVGAPRSNISDPSVPHSGGVFGCPLSGTTGTQVCHEVHVNLSSAGSYSNITESNSSEQSLGFSLASSDKELVVCAPRRYASKTIYNRRNFLPVGMCFSAKSPDYEFQPFSPPFQADPTLQISYLTTGSCQFGISAAYIKSQNTFALGAPGCWGWQGDTWEINMDVSLSRHVERLTRNDLDLDSSNWNFYYIYMGYSVASLKFGDNYAILSSIPRRIWPEDTTSSTHFGPTILILSQDNKNDSHLIVEQRISPSEANADEVSFSLFGHSLATLDMNGDGLEDLVVGAPLYQGAPDQNQRTAVGYDYGAIFVYMQSQSEKVYQMIEEKNAPQRRGTEPFSRFGSCVAAVGDLDGDGYEDLAVGAPFMKVDSQGGTGTGAVYIYMGSRSGLEKDAVQIIKAAPNQYGFGSSIAQRLQIVEGKGYDIAVGIYDSDKVLVFKSKDVVDIVIWDLTFSKVLHLSQNDCPCSEQRPDIDFCPCVEAKVCLKYQRKFKKFADGVTLDFNITLATDSDLFFENGEGEIKRNITVKEDEEACTTYQVMSEPNKDEIKSYTFVADLNLAREEKNVILARNSDLRKEENLNVYVPCASGDVSGCQSNIKLVYDILAGYIFDSQPMKIKFEVRNQGETAYEARLNIKSNDIFNIMGSDENKNVKCEKNRNKEIECQLGHLSNDQKETFILELAPSKESLTIDALSSHESAFDMTAEVKTLSSISNPAEAVQNFQVDIRVNGSLALSKKPSDPSIVFFNSSSYYKPPEDANFEEEVGPEIKHTYTILNSNDFEIFGADLIIEWPLTIDGKYFLYLMEYKFSGMTPSCQDTNGKVNPFNLGSKPTRVIRSQEDQDSEMKKSALSAGIGHKNPEYMTIKCHFGVFSKVDGNREVTIELRSRLVMRTLAELKAGAAVTSASSSVDLQITKMPFNVVPPLPSHSTIATRISYKDDEPDIKVPVWLYVAATLGGLLVLSIIIIIMWKCGFFKRKRVEAADKAKGNEKQPDENEEATTPDAEEYNLTTPTTPMLHETECARNDFEFHSGE